MRTLRLSVAVAVTAGLCGCASTHSPTSARDDGAVDYAKINAVDHVARTNGINVYWLHYPRLQQQTATN
jgi:uncharacterized protein YceK